MKFVLVTSTFRGDLDSFRDLCTSIDRLMPDVEHHVLVDRSDHSIFETFASANRLIVSNSAILPQFHEFTFMGRRLWWRAPFFVARGWIYQQLAKIAYVATLDVDAAAVVDSDLQFVHPLCEEDFVRDGSIRLSRFPKQSSGAEFSRWHDAAMRSLGLEPRGYTGADYICQPVFWSPEIVREMIGTIEKKSRKKWFDVLVRNFRFSEYILYGIYCDQVLGTDAPVFHSSQEICHYSWHYDLTKPDGRRAFEAGLQPGHKAICLQSNLKLPHEERVSIINKILSKNHIERRTT